MIQLTDNELIELFDKQLPDLLDRRPELEPLIYRAFIKTFAAKEEVAAVLSELRDFRVEARQRFDRQEDRMNSFEKRMDSLEERMEAGFRELHRAVDRLGGRWGIRNESIFRQTMAELLEKTFGFKVEECSIQGEQFDCVIHNGEHILVEISASVGPKIQERLERKSRIYTEETGIAPSRVILVTAAIHSHRAQVLREAGFEVIEPEEDTIW